jgi:uncharacterized protein YaiI (UPF0178 family)
MPDLYIDVDVHEVYVQAVRAARRYSLELYVITRDYLPAEENVHLIAVEDDQVNGGAWIAANITRGDICVTTDPDVAANCIQRGALALAPTGRQWSKDPANNDSRRVVESWPADVHAFAQRLDRVIVSARAMSPRAFASSQAAHRSGFVEPRELASTPRAVF